jgi:hypothetical protein
LKQTLPFARDARNSLTSLTFSEVSQKRGIFCETRYARRNNGRLPFKQQQYAPAAMLAVQSAVRPARNDDIELKRCQF